MKIQYGNAGELRRFVLVVDDEYVNREILGNLIRDEYHVLYAVNGAEALEVIRENISTLSVVLLDLMMPEMDGFAVIEHMQADEWMKHIPIIVLTSEQDAEVKSLKLGAADFIKKPYRQPEVIRARIRRTIELSEDRRFIAAAERDELTGLYSPAFFFEHALVMDHYHPDLRTDAVILNIEHFHLVNEIYGRSFGDEVLKTVAGTIGEFLSGTEGLACRSEADTFYLYTAHRESYEGLLSALQRDLAKLSGTLHIRFRIGVYARVEHELPMEERFSDARFACNTLRGNYMRYVAYYDISLREHSVFLEHLISDIHEGLKRKQIGVAWQPKYDVTGEEPRLAGAEALVRWEHPVYGSIRPKQFLPVFETNGLIGLLDRHVIREAAEQLKQWRESFPTDMTVSVNISRIDLYDAGLPGFLTETLRENGLTPADLTLEITESAYTDDQTALMEAVERLRRDGFHIEMDGFGSGYSSLNSLTTLPLDALSLDVEFIRSIHEDARVHKVVDLILELARFIGVPVIAEGVETAAQFDLLKDLGCRFVQGYYFSKPLSPREFQEYVLSEEME